MSHAETISRIEQASGQLATASIARMDEQLPWFRALPADQRSWVTLLVQSGIASYIEWLRQPGDVLRLTNNVFAAAPRTMARSVTLQQTVELIRQTINVVEERVPPLVLPDDRAHIREEMLRFSREIAFAAARVYASAAESRGAWDARLEALVIDGLVRGNPIGEDPLSQLAALGWRSTGPVTAIVGLAPVGASATSSRGDELRGDIHRAARRLGLDALAGLQGERLVLILGNVDDPMQAARELLDSFGDGPVVVAPRAEDVSAASTVTQAALSGLRAVVGWPDAPRPVSSDALLPERALIGDLDARQQLIENVYLPLAKAGDVLLETASAFLASGGALEATARALYVHANTVRYRLKRVGDICGESPTSPRGAFTLQMALAIGRLDTSS
jgi:hypothetical protein